MGCTVKIRELLPSALYVPVHPNKEVIALSCRNALLLKYELSLSKVKIVSLLEPHTQTDFSYQFHYFWFEFSLCYFLWTCGMSADLLSQILWLIIGYRFNYCRFEFLYFLWTCGMSTDLVLLFAWNSLLFCRSSNPEILYRIAILKYFVNF